MSSTLERLRRLHSLRPQREDPTPALPGSGREEDPTPALPKLGREQVGASDETAPKQPVRLEMLVPGAVIENSAGRCYVTTHAYPLHVDRGPRPLGDLLAHQPTTFAPFHPNFGLGAQLDFRRAAFIDTETTGLGAGAGVYCFMVGVGTFEGRDQRLETRDQRPETRDQRPETRDQRPETRDQRPETRDLYSNLQSSVSSLQSPVSSLYFVVRQFFMRHPGEEGALLLALTELLEGCELSVTFNGRTFDLPLLRARLQQNQHSYPDLRGSGRLLQPERPHLDLLHPARRLWKRRLQSCRLIHLEQEILGLQRSEQDVPGHLIPALYTDYVRSGDASEMGRIFYHNREDVISMVALAEQLSRLYATPSAETPSDNLHGLDWLALGQCYEQSQQWGAAENAYRHALEQLGGMAAQADAFARLGQTLKQQARWSEAATVWEEWLTTVRGVDPTPYVELAKYCEWQLKDLEQAAMWSGWALHNLRTAPAASRNRDAIGELEHRLMRLQRKQSNGA